MVLQAVGSAHGFGEPRALAGADLTIQPDVFAAQIDARGLARSGRGVGLREVFSGCADR